MSNLQYIYSRNDKIKSIKQFKTEENTLIYLISSYSGNIYVQDISRISRFWRGANYAFARLYRQYVPADSIINKKLIVQNPRVILDIGANIGEFAIFCANNFLESEIHAFEPDPIAFKCLQLNLQNFGLESRVFINNIALSNTNEVRTFYLATSSADSSLMEPASYLNSITVKTKRLEDFLNHLKIERVALLKMDAEGYEPEVIKGLGKLISSCETLTIDVSPERAGISTLDETAQLFDKDVFFTEVFPGEGERIFLCINSYQSI